MIFHITIILQRSCRSLSEIAQIWNNLLNAESLEDLGEIHQASAFKAFTSLELPIQPAAYDASPALPLMQQVRFSAPVPAYASVAPRVSLAVGVVVAPCVPVAA